MDFTLLGVLKILILVGVLIYIIFAAIVVKQVKIMNSTVRTGLELPIKMSSYLHLAFAVLVFLFALLAL